MNSQNENVEASLDAELTANDEEVHANFFEVPE